MPHRLKQRQAKIQAKRRTTPWREFVMEICSWKNMLFYPRKWFISIFPPDQQRISNIVSPKEFEDIRWNDSLELNNSRSFFDHFSELLVVTPLPWTLDYWWNENADYCDSIYGIKNWYLSSIVWWWCENVAYSFDVRYNSTNIFNSLFVNTNCDRIFNSTWITWSTDVSYSKYIKDSNDIWFSTNLIWCSSCIGCNNLQNLSYHIHNIPYTKEEYTRMKKEILQEKNTFENKYSSLQNVPAINRWSTGEISWSHIIQSSNIENGYNVCDTHTWRNIILAGSPHDDRDYYDSIIVWRATNFRGICVWWGFSEHCYLTSNVWGWSYGIYYSFFIDGCSYCLWCIWLKNKSYCIFNKQYTKEERYDKIDEIFTQMEKDGDLGKFFPWSMNPFYFNDTAAYLIDDSFTKEEVEAHWYMRRDDEIKVDIPAWVDVISVDELDQYEGWKNTETWKTFRHSERSEESRQVQSWLDPSFQSGWQTITLSNTSPNRRDDGTASSSLVRHISPSILKKVIRDDQWNVYRIVKMEYDFLMKHGLPLPRTHWLERIKQHFKIQPIGSLSEA